MARMYQFLSKIDYNSLISQPVTSYKKGGDHYNVRIQQFHMPIRCFFRKLHIYIHTYI